MRFRLVWYDTDSDDRFDSEEYQRHEYLGSRQDIISLWILLRRILEKKHVSVYSLDGHCEIKESDIELPFVHDYTI